MTEKAIIIFPALLVLIFSSLTAEARFTGVNNQTNTSTSSGLTMAASSTAGSATATPQATSSTSLDPNTLFKNIRNALSIELPGFHLNLISGPISDFFKQKTILAGDALRKSVYANISDILHRINEAVKKWIDQFRRDFGTLRS